MLEMNVLFSPHIILLFSLGKLTNVVADKIKTVHY